jgi:arginyl-tRNA synthetase
MSTLTREGLESLLDAAGLKTPIPAFTDVDVLLDPLNIFRCYLADIVHGIVKGDKASALGSIQLPPTVDFFAGDLTIILPRLARELGVKVEDLNHSIVQNVRGHFPTICV